MNIIGTAKVIVKSSDVKAKSKSGNSFTAKIGEKGKFTFNKVQSGSYLLNTKSGSSDLYSIAYVQKDKTERSNPPFSIST